MFLLVPKGIYHCHLTPSNWWSRAMKVAVEAADFELPAFMSGQGAPQGSPTGNGHWKIQLVDFEGPPLWPIVMACWVWATRECLAP